MKMEKELDEIFGIQRDSENEVKEEYCEQLLDVAGLARAYKMMSSSNNYGLYKNALSIAISSLCGKYLDNKNSLLIQSNYSYIVFLSKNHCRITIFQVQIISHQ